MDIIMVDALIHSQYVKDVGELLNSCNGLSLTNKILHSPACIASVKGKTVGVLCFEVGTLSTKVPMAFRKNIYVSVVAVNKWHRRQGIASELIEFIKRYYGTFHIYITAQTDRRRWINMVGRHGFQHAFTLPDGRIAYYVIKGR